MSGVPGVVYFAILLGTLELASKSPAGSRRTGDNATMFCWHSAGMLGVSLGVQTIRDRWFPESDAASACASPA